MKKQLILIALFLGAVLNLMAANDEATKGQLNQLASEMTAFLVGTPDATFESCSYKDGQLVFVINPKSKIGQYRIANPFEENFYEKILTQMFSGNPQQGLMVMNFLKDTHTQICFIIPDHAETAIWPGTVIPYIEQLFKEQQN